MIDFTDQAFWSSALANALGTLIATIIITRINIAQPYVVRNSTAA